MTAAEAPLAGKRVLITRAANQAAELVELLEALGAEPILAPMIRIAPPDDFAPVDAACERFEQFDWIVFSSVNAVEAVLDRMPERSLDLLRNGRVRICAVGSATRDRLARRGLKVDVVPGEFRAEALAAALSKTGGLRGVAVFIPRSDIGRDVVARALRERGAEVTDVVAYRTEGVDVERHGGPDLRRLLLDRHVDVVTFTSPSAVRHFVKSLGESDPRRLLGTAIVACIGPVTAEAAAEGGIQTAVMPREYTVPAMVAAIADYYRSV